MPAKEEIEITIAPDGAVQMHLKGYKGKKCAEVMKRLSRELGTVSEQRFTSEYYEPEADVEIHRRTSGF